MSAFRNDPPGRPPMRRSTKVALVLLGTTGVIGGALAWDAWQRAQRREDNKDTENVAVEATTSVRSDRTYTNNEYVPGVGYYHAPFYGFFPFPWNFRDPQRGYFSGGEWRATPNEANLASSQPRPEAVAAAAAAAQRAREKERRASPSSNFVGTANRPPAYTPRPSPAPSKSSPSITRGGFGSSSRSGVS